MPQINHRESDEVSTKKTSVQAVKSEQKGPEFIDPSKGAFAHKAMFVDLPIEETSGPALS